jgi:hypothetical protein
VIALRDLARYVDEKAVPAHPLEIMERRKSAQRAPTAIPAISAPAPAARPSTP